MDQKHSYYSIIFHHSHIILYITKFMHAENNVNLYVKFCNYRRPISAIYNYQQLFMWPWDRKIMRCPSSGKKFKVRTLKIALEIESLVHEYIEYPLYYILVHGYYRIQCRTYCKVMTQ